MRYLRTALLAALTCALLASPAGAVPGQHGTWLPDTLPNLPGSHAVVDSAGDRLLLVQPTSSTTLVWSVPLGIAPGVAHPALLPVAGTPPAGVFDPSLVYVRDSAYVVMFGGWRTGGAHPRTSVDSLYLLRLGDAPRWERLHFPGARPMARFGHVATSFRFPNQVIVHGGQFVPANGAPQDLTDTWRLVLNGSPFWDSLEVGGPRPRFSHLHPSYGGADRQRSRFVFGDAGSDSTWTLDLSGPLAWTYVTHGGARPVSRIEGVAAEDANGAQLFVIGLLDSTSVRKRDVYALDYATLQWRRVEDLAEPPSTYAHPSAAVDPRRGLLYLCGTGTHEDGAWTLPTASGAGWLRSFGRSPGPGGLWMGALFVDPVTNTVRLLGEGGGYSRWAVMWSSPLDGPADARFRWTSDTLAHGIALAREGASSAYDSKRRALLLYGGSPMSGGLLQDLYRLPLPGLWDALAPGGEQPPGDVAAPALYDPAGDRMLVYVSRHEGPTPSHELWALSLATVPPRWTLLPAATSPVGDQARQAVALDTRRNRLVLFGGTNPRTNATWVYDLAARSPGWKQLQPTGAPPPGGGACLMYDPIGDRMLVYGGTDESNYPTGGLWQLTFGDPPVWSELYPSNAPGLWSAGRVVYDAAHDRMLAYGGVDDYSAELRVLQWDRDRTIPPPLGPPTNQLRLSALVNPSSSDLRLSLFVPSAATASLDVFDIGGRRVYQRDLGLLVAGSFVVNVSTGLPSGLYWVRVRQGGHEGTARVAVLN